jgi:hypothetical protein
MAWELWNRMTANMVAEFDTESSALEYVRASMKEHGPTLIQEWALAHEDDEGETAPIAAGDKLIDLARRKAPASRAT